MTKDKKGIEEFDLKKFMDAGKGDPAREQYSDGAAALNYYVDGYIYTEAEGRVDIRGRVVAFDEHGAPTIIETTTGRILHISPPMAPPS